MMRCIAHHDNAYRGGDIGDLYLGHGPSDLFVHLHPELPCVRLRFRVRRPVVPNVLVFAGDLTVVTTVALCYVDDERFHGYLPPLTQARVTNPHAESYSFLKASG